uniref:G-protein coupled receptors family 2 profile 2 domain-containing protein n=1 Tax=Ciona savignyi TaxID=51511 RepID=H2YFU2_CIOSA
MIVNFIILVRVLIVAAATQRRRFLRQQNPYTPTTSNKLQKSVMTVARGVFFLTPLLGLSWVVGFFVDQSVVLSYLFVLTNSFQGVYLLLFYVILNPEVKLALQERKRAKRRNFLAISGLESARSPHSSWKQRFSFSLLSKLTLSPSTSENTSPVSNVGGKSPKEVQDFNEENLSSRPCSGRSINLSYLTSPVL